MRLGIWRLFLGDSEMESHAPDLPQRYDGPTHGAIYYWVNNRMCYRFDHRWGTSVLFRHLVGAPPGNAAPVPVRNALLLPEDHGALQMGAKGADHPKTARADEGFATSKSWPPPIITIPPNNGIASHLPP